MNEQDKNWEEIKKELVYAKNECIKRKATHDVLTKELQEVQNHGRALGEKREQLEKVRVLFQQAADHARNQAKEQLEIGVTNALKYVFGPTFQFEIKLEDHGGTPHAEFYVVTEWEGKQISTRPQDARGGGVIDLLSLALRISLLETHHLNLKGPLLLDEPGKHLSEDYIPLFIEFLRSISDAFGRQIILVTHNVHLTESADATYHVRISKGCSQVKNSRLLDNENT